MRYLCNIESPKQFLSELNQIDFPNVRKHIPENLWNTRFVKLKDNATSTDVFESSLLYNM